MARARAALKRETRRKGKKTANGMEGEGKGAGERVWAEQAHRHAEGTSGGSRPLCIPNSNQLIGCWLEIELDRNVRVCVAVARRRKGKRVRERVCNKGDREGAEGCQRGRRGASGWLKKRGTAADLVLLCSPCARNINASHFSSRPPSDESVSLSLSPFSVAHASLSFLAEAETVRIPHAREPPLFTRLTSSIACSESRLYPSFARARICID